MFYSDNDNMLPFQLVSTKDKSVVLIFLLRFSSSYTLLQVMQSLVEIKITDLITLLCKSGTTNDTATF